MNSTATNCNLQRAGAGYIVYNSSRKNFQFINNYWGTTDSATIDAKIYDIHDNSSMGEIQYNPYRNSRVVLAPNGLDYYFENNICHLSWNPRRVETLKYYVYYDTDSPNPPYQGTGLDQGSSPIDVGTNTSIDLTNLQIGLSYYVTVTAFDMDGTESVYSEVLVVVSYYEGTPTTTPTATPIPTSTPTLNVQDQIWPLSVGNMWNYEVTDFNTSSTESYTTSVTGKSNHGGMEFYDVANIFNTQSVVYMLNFYYGLTMYSLGQPNNLAMLYKYPGEVGDKWVINYLPGNYDSVEIISTNTFLVTDIGEFSGCYVYKVEEHVQGDYTFHYLCLCPSVGLVYDINWLNREHIKQQHRLTSFSLSTVKTPTPTPTMQPPVAGNILPLKVGNRWSYIEEIGSINYQTKVTGTQTLDGINYYVVNNVLNGGVNIYFRNTYQGLIAHGQAVGEVESLMYKYPGDVGDETLVFFQNANFDRIRLVGTDENITVPAGTIEHCYRYKVYENLASGFITHDIWWRPGIGLIYDEVKQNDSVTLTRHKLTDYYLVPEGLTTRNILGGYWDTYLSSAGGGWLNLYAVVDYLGEQQVDSVQMYYGGIPTGIFLTRQSPILFTFTALLGPGVPQGHYGLELLAEDAATTAKTNLWPHLCVD